MKKWIWSLFSITVMFAILVASACASSKASAVAAKPAPVISTTSVPTTTIAATPPTTSVVVPITTNVPVTTSATEPSAATTATPPTTSAAVPTTITPPVTATATPPQVTNTTTAPATEAPKIELEPGAYNPLNLTIAVGTTVVFDNPDDADVVLVSEYPFTQKILLKTHFDFTFAKAGVYKYWAEGQPSYKGTVTVN
jgi:plastocyanin